MLTIHHLNNSRSQRIIWLAEELGLDYQIQHHTRHDTTLRSPQSLMDVHPLGKAPVIEYEHHVIAESGAIIEFMTRVLGNGQLSIDPSDDEYAEYCHWLHFVEGSLQPPIIVDLIYDLTAYMGKNAAFYQFYEIDLIKHQAYLTQALADRDYLLVSGFSAVDIHLAWLLELATVRGLMGPYPVLSAYLKRLTERPAYLRSLEKGGGQDLSPFAKAASNS